MAAIKTVEVRVEPRIRDVEVGGGLPGSPGADGVSITGASINGSGHLILTLSSGGPVDAGYVVGPQGNQGDQGDTGPQGVSITGASIDGSGNLILTLSVGGPLDAGHVVGPQGDQGDVGPQGVSITGASINGSGHLILTLSSGGPVDVGYVVGPQGDQGDIGPQGASIVGAAVDGSYHLIIELSTGATVDAGYVRGPAGADGTGTGDVVGIAPSVAGRFAAYTDTTGKEIEDSGVGPNDFASAAQGVKADSAVQPGDIGTAAAQDVGFFATAAQGALADSAVQPGDIGSAAAEDVGFFATAAQGALADSAVQPGDIGTAAPLDAGTAAGNVPVLDGSGLLDTSILPALALSDVFVVASQAAMLALTAQRGDFAIRTDTNSTFVLSTNSPSTLADWKEIVTPTDGIVSVAGITTATISASALLTALGLSTSDSPQFAGLNIGHASDTTIARVSAGLISVEGDTVALLEAVQTLVNKTYGGAVKVQGYAFNTSTGAAVDIATNGVLQVPTLTGNWTPGTGWPAATLGHAFRMILKSGAGSFTVTWPASVKWPAATAPTLTATASKADVIDFESDGTNWYGYVVAQDYAV